jgi:hypothetical protein
MAELAHSNCLEFSNRDGQGVKGIHIRVLSDTFLKLVLVIVFRFLKAFLTEFVKAIKTFVSSPLYILIAPDTLIPISLKFLEGVR